ncbi:MAG TPA: RNA polymerase sigma factor RpoD, partial [Glaciecola sp.]|nr:RNA polymerase sigma factor RpoD [Glaciecola sp.]
MQSKQSQIKLLIAKGKEQGYLTFAEVNDHLPQDIVDSDQIEDIISMINDMGIQVFESAPDADELLMAESTTDEEVAEAAAQALATVESEIGRTTDPVRMYMREMGTVELLTREGEIEIAKRIEDGINQVQCSVAEYPEAITYLLDQWDLYEAEEIRLSDIIIGFVDPNEEANLAPTATHIGSDLSKEELEKEDDDSEGDEEEEEDTGPDPELAREKFDALRKQYAKTRDAIEAKGRSNATAKRQIAALSDVFKEFRLIPKQFDRMVKNMRGMMDRVRIQERLIMKHCVAQAKMPKKDFIKAFAGNETSTDWYFKILKSNKPYVLVLETFQEDIERSVSKMNAVEAETGLCIADIKDINRRMSIGEAKARRAKKEMVEA